MPFLILLGDPRDTVLAAIALCLHHKTVLFATHAENDVHPSVVTDFLQTRTTLQEFIYDIDDLSIRTASPMISLLEDAFPTLPNLDEVCDQITSAKQKHRQPYGEGHAVWLNHQVCEQLLSLDESSMFRFISNNHEIQILTVLSDSVESWMTDAVKLFDLESRYPRRFSHMFLSDMCSPQFWMWYKRVFQITPPSDFQTDYTTFLKPHLNSTVSTPTQHRLLTSIYQHRNPTSSPITMQVLDQLRQRYCQDILVCGNYTLPSQIY